MTNHTTFGIEDFNDDIVVARIQNRRGNRVNLPQPLEPGELGWCLDTKQLFIGLTEDNAVPGVEIYRGETANAQALAQQEMDRRMIEFNSYYRRVNEFVQLQQDPNTTASEVDLLVELRSIPSSTFVDKTKRAIVDETEQNIEIIQELNQNVADSLTNGYNFSNQALITYDWVQEDAKPAEIEVVAALTGEVTSVVGFSSGEVGLGYIADVLDNAALNPYLGNVTLTVRDGDPGTATFVGRVSPNGDGKLTSVSLIDGGTGHVTGPVVLEEPTQRATQATVLLGTVILDAGTGAILSIPLASQGRNYTGKPKVTIVEDNPGDPGSGAIVEAIVTAGKITFMHITSGGANYVNPKVTIEPPLSDQLYSFTYDFGVENKDNEDFINAGADDYAKLHYSVEHLTTAPSASAIENAGVFGLAPSTGNLPSPPALPGIPYVFNPHSNEIVSGFLYLGTARQSSNVASIINELSDAPTGLVTSKQNVEILSEFSAQELSSDVLIDNPFTYELRPTATFAKVTNDIGSGGTGTYTTLDLEYSIFESDVQHFDYSTHLSSLTTGYSSSGVMSVVSNPLTTGVQTSLSDTSNEVRDSSLLPLNAGGPDIEFRSVYNSLRNVVEIEYRHDFVPNIVLKLTTKRWNSF